MYYYYIIIIARSSIAGTNWGNGTPTPYRTTVVRLLIWVTNEKVATKAGGVESVRLMAARRPELSWMDVTMRDITGDYFPRRSNDDLRSRSAPLLCL
jgi:hypothetical protein